MRRVALTAVGIALAILVGAPAAGAATRRGTSSNWAGYVIARTGVEFRRASATWVQPTASCTPGRRSYSAFWVGLGGYRSSSTALEQIGTEADCSAAGTASYSAWYELVPAASARIAIHAGDTVAASVNVGGDAVRLRLVDRTTGASFTKVLSASTVDLGSAEWIAEAPSACDEAGRCEVLPLADFGSVGFSHASARTTAGHAGPIDAAAWSSVAITLAAGGPGPPGARFAALSGRATPSALSASGDGFTVAYEGDPGAA
jgi:Peptidase A4 family